MSATGNVPFLRRNETKPPGTVRQTAALRLVSDDRQMLEMRQSRARRVGYAELRPREHLVTG